MGAFHINNFQKRPPFVGRLSVASAAGVGGSALLPGAFQRAREEIGGALGLRWEVTPGASEAECCRAQAV